MYLGNWLSPEFLISTFGLLGIFSIVFAESGLLFGFFLPGDSLLLTAGLFASRGNLDLFTLIIICTLGAVLGDTVGYWFGRKTGSKLFDREESRLFKKSHLQKAQLFYDRHGGKTIILARFMPFVRTFAPIVAGAAKMDYKKFLAYNLLGGLGWGAGMPLVGFTIGTWLRNKFTPKQVDNYFLMIVLVVIGLSVLPTIVHLLKDRQARNKLLAIIRDIAYALPGLNPNRQS